MKMTQVPWWEVLSHEFPPSPPVPQCLFRTSPWGRLSGAPPFRTSSCLTARLCPFQCRRPFRHARSLHPSTSSRHTGMNSASALFTTLMLSPDSFFIFQTSHPGTSLLYLIFVYPLSLFFFFFFLTITVSSDPSCCNRFTLGGKDYSSDTNCWVLNWRFILCLHMWCSWERFKFRCGDAFNLLSTPSLNSEVDAIQPLAAFELR